MPATHPPQPLTQESTHVVLLPLRFPLLTLSLFLLYWDYVMTLIPLPPLSPSAPLPTQFLTLGALKNLRFAIYNLHKFSRVHKQSHRKREVER